MSHSIAVIILGIFTGYASAVSAQTTAGTVSLHPEAASSSPTSIKSRNKFELRQSEYFSYGLPEFRDGAAKQNSSVLIHLDEQLKKGWFEGHLKGRDEWSATENWNYGDVFELYAAARTDSTQLSLGRKLETWSLWDKEWQQGAFQPRYMENRMRMDQAGLTGAFLNLHNDHLSATLAGLIFVPDFGAHFYTANGKLVSKNPWFHPPADRFILRNGLGEIHYRVDQPEASKVIAHAGAAAKFEFKRRGYLTRLSGAYKPMPQFVLAFPSANQFVTNQTEDHMNISVTPRVTYDRIVNLDQSFETKEWAFSASLAYSNPEDKTPAAGWTTQEVRSATIWSGGVERRFAQSSNLRLGFLKVNGGDARDSGPLAGDKTLFERRFQFYEAYLLSLHKSLPIGTRYPLDSEVRVIYDRLQGGGLVAFNSGIFLTRDLRAEIEADFIGLLTSDAVITDGFLDEYRANDRFSLGMSYAF